MITDSPTPTPKWLYFWFSARLSKLNVFLLLWTNWGLRVTLIRREQIHTKLFKKQGPMRLFLYIEITENKVWSKPWNKRTKENSSFAQAAAPTFWKSNLSNSPLCTLQCVLKSYATSSAPMSDCITHHTCQQFHASFTRSVLKVTAQNYEFRFEWWLEIQIQFAKERR